MTIPGSTDAPSSGGREEPRPRSSLRGLMEWAAVVVGGLLILLGWYGISGKAVVAQQIPYLASASLPGVGLLVAGSVFIASDRSRRSSDNAAEMVASLYRLLTEAVDAPAADAAPVAPVPPRTATGVVSVPEGTRYHRSDCALVADKPAATTVSRAEIDERGLVACPICEPTTPES
ncbi:MAG: hypothetical protein U0Q22_08140 [Acidimicrobiales bacterium]